MKSNQPNTFISPIKADKKIFEILLTVKRKIQSSKVYKIHIKIIIHTYNICVAR